MTNSLLTTAIALFGAIIAINQLRIAANQRRLADATSQAANYAAWRDLEDPWNWSILVAYGPTDWGHSRVEPDNVAEYTALLKRYKDAAYRHYTTHLPPESGVYDTEVIDQASIELAQVEAELDTYRAYVDKILGFFGRMATLVVSSRISVQSAYNSFGPDVVANRRAIMVLTGESPLVSDHPGVYMPIFSRMKELELGELSSKLGWSGYYSDLPGFLQRIRALVSLMIAHAVVTGDHSAAAPEHAEGLHELDSSAVRIATKTESIVSAFRLLRRMDAASARREADSFIYFNTPGSTRPRGRFKSFSHRAFKTTTFPIRFIGLRIQGGYVRDGLYIDQ